MVTRRMIIGNKFEKKAISDLEERGYKVIDANELKKNNPTYDLIVKCSDGSEVLVSVKSVTDRENWPIANGKIKKMPDGSYDGTEKIKKKLIEGGFTFVYHEIENRGIYTVYIIPHDVIKPLFSLWVSHRNGREHTFIINRKTAKEIGLDIQKYEKAWNLLPTA